MRRAPRLRDSVSFSTLIDMYSDTHFHFPQLCDGDVSYGAQVLTALVARGCFFGLDIGTQADDVFTREAFAAKCMQQIADDAVREQAGALLYFSAGIWPAAGAITARTEQVETLAAAIMQVNDQQQVPHARVVAVGECGLDHHWNPGGVDGRTPFDAALIHGEAELFEMQLALAHKLQLPVIVHSRDAYADTLACIKRSGYDNGVIHCYSYGAEEAVQFVERGWYIAFGGAVTYAKKHAVTDIQRTIRAVPDERLLLETDAPYLSPVPLRGQKNTPLNIEHTYRFVAAARGTTVEALSAQVDENVRRLFSV